MRHLLRYKLICASQADALAVQTRINTELAGHPAAVSVKGPTVTSWHDTRWMVHGVLRWTTTNNADTFRDKIRTAWNTGAVAALILSGSVLIRTINRDDEGQSVPDQYLSTEAKA